MKISDFDREHVGEIVAGHGDWFSAHLLRLMAKADADNLALLGLVFPDHLEAFIAWRDQPQSPAKVID